MNAPRQPTPAADAVAAAAPGGAAWLRRLAAYRRFWWLAVTVFVLDQLTKGWIATRLSFPTYGPPRHLPVIDGFFHLVHVGNTGAAWSLFSGRGVWLGALAALTLVAIYFWRRALGLRQPAAQLCFGLLCGGTLGNLVDRLQHGHVIDFLDFHFGRYIYPTFNIADMGIVVGVFGYIFWSLRQPTPPGR